MVTVVKGSVSESVSILAFPGAVVGGGDNHAAMQAAVDSDAKVIRFPSQDVPYYTSAPVVVPSGKTLLFDKGQGVYTDYTVTSSGTYPNDYETANVFFLNGSANISTTLSGVSVKGASSINVVSSAGLSVGDLIRVCDNTVFDVDFYYESELNYVTAIAGNVVHLSGVLNFSYNSGDVLVVTPCEDSHIIGASFDQSNDTITRTNGVGGKYALNCSVQDCTGTALKGKIVSLWDSYGISTRNCGVTDAQDTDPGNGYGIQYLRCRNSAATSSNFRNLRHAVDFAGGSDLVCMGNQAEYVDGTVGTAAYSMGHGLRANRVLCTNNTSNNYPLGVLVGNPTYGEDYGVITAHNTISGATGTAAIFYTVGGSGAVVSSNIISGSTQSDISLTGQNEVIISNNICGGTTSGTRATITVFDSNTISLSGNIVKDSSFYGVQCSGCTDVAISGGGISNSTSEGIYINTHEGYINLDNVTVDCANVAKGAVYISGVDGTHIEACNVTNVLINGEPLITSGFLIEYADRLNVSECNIDGVIEGVRVQGMDYPKITNNYISNCTNGIRLVDVGSVAMSEFYIEGNVGLSNGDDLYNSTAATLGTFF